MRTIFLIIFFFNLLFFPKFVLGTEMDKIVLLDKCLKNADHPSNKTGGPDWDNLDTKKALDICNLAYKKNPNSVQIIRSLARIYAKKNDYKKANEFIFKNEKKNDPYSLWFLGMIYEDGSEVDQNFKKSLIYFEQSASYKYALAFNSLGDIYQEGKGVKQDYNKALEYFRLAADQGLDIAQNNIGLTFYDGLGVNKDYQKALLYFKLAADQGLDVALNNVGVAYQFEQGVEKDYLEAVKYYKLSADKGYSVAQNNLADMYYHGKGVTKDYNKAFEYYKLAADQGYDEAQNNVGLAYKNGEGVAKNHQKSFKYFKLATNQEHDDALNNLGLMYYYGEGVKIDYKKAFKYFKLAADQGYSVSQNNVGVAYEYGEGIEKNSKKAFKYYKLAADQGYDEAQNNVGLAYNYGEGVEKNYKKAFDFFKLSADQGYDEAQNNVGLSYQLGEGVEKSTFKALEYFKLASKQGNIKSIANIGNLYETEDIELYMEYHEKAGKMGHLESYNSIGWKFHQGDGVPRNYKKAHKYYEMAKGDSYALDNLGTLYWKGEGVEANFQKAIEYYEKSIDADLENSYPLYHLGMMYYKGHGVERNMEKAIKLFSKSAIKGNSKAAVELSDIYEIGIGVKKDYIKAKELLKMAEEFPSEGGYFNLRAIKQFKMKSLNKIVENQGNNKKDLGKFVAILIGINKYDEFPHLQTPLKDIKVLGEILKNKFNFEIINLINPSRKVITSSLSKLEKTILKKDNLLIYFAGHGILKDDYGYWLPKNAEQDDDSYWISNDYVTKKIKSIKANNILVIADSCYSGSLTRGIKSIDHQRTLPVDTYLNTKSRMVISSGGIKPVMDGGGGGHSVFARMLINKLKKDNKPLISSELYSAIAKQVTEVSKTFNIEQIPTLASLPMSGHEAPDFVFIPKHK